MLRSLRLSAALSRLSLTACLLAGAVGIVGSAGGCRTTQAYVDWRPGLSEVDFDGFFELSRADYQGYAERALPNTHLDSFRGQSRGEGEAAAAELDARLRGGEADPDGDGYAIVGLTSAEVTLLEAGGAGEAAAIDWFAVTGDRSMAAVLAGTRLAVVAGSASTGIEVGGLLGAGTGSYRFMLLDNEGELTIFILPELGGAITANEPGYVFTFVPTPGSKQAWEISVGRVTVAM